MLDEGLAQAIPDTPGNIDQYLALAQQNSSMTHRDLDRRHDHQGLPER